MSKTIIPNTNERFQFIIALVIVVPFISFIGIFYWSGMTQDAKDIIATLGAFVGTIIGFYFGQRPVQNLTQQVAEITSKKQGLSNSYFGAKDIITSDGAKMKQLQNEIKDLKKTIEILKEEGKV